jgi:hypothetical protein
MRSKLIQQVDSVVSVPAQVITASGSAYTKKGTGWAHTDDNGALGRTDSAVVITNCGLSSGATATVTMTVQESDTDVDGNYANVTPSATLPVVSVTSSTASVVQFFFKTAGLKKFVRVVNVFATAGATDTVPFSQEVVRGDGNVDSHPRGTVPAVFSKA